MSKSSILRYYPIRKVVYYQAIHRPARPGRPACWIHCPRTTTNSATIQIVRGYGPMVTLGSQHFASGGRGKPGPSHNPTLVKGWPTPSPPNLWLVRHPSGLLGSLSRYQYTSRIASGTPGISL
jgi:hypothetical protein